MGSAVLVHDTAVADPISPKTSISLKATDLHVKAGTFEMVMASRRCLIAAPAEYTAVLADPHSSKNWIESKASVLEETQAKHETVFMMAKEDVEKVVVDQNEAFMAKEEMKKVVGNPKDAYVEPEAQSGRKHMAMEPDICGIDALLAELALTGADHLEPTSVPSCQAGSGKRIRLEWHPGFMNGETL